jgi:Zn-dependent peptidase ImmA (M78 family)
VFSLPVAVVRASRISVENIRTWLIERDLKAVVPPCSGEMAGCVVAYRGHAFIFVCGTDPEDEIRITLAHEVAHLLRHYLRPRAEAKLALGLRVTEVLDGDRPPTFHEQVHAALSSAPLGTHVHLMPRGSDPRVLNQVEREADELAFELVAPQATVLALLKSSGLPDRPRERREQLARYFGIPPRWFTRLVPDRPLKHRDPLDHLFASLRSSQ